MVIDRATGAISHRTFADLVDLVQPNDVLVVNRTRVFRARLLGVRDSGAPAEILLLKPLGEGRYEAMVSPGGKLKPGRRVTIAPDSRCSTSMCSSSDSPGGTAIVYQRL